MNDTEPLISLSLDEEGFLISIPEHTSVSRRLLDLGFIPGTHIRCALVGPHAELAAYRIRGTTIALRKEDASQIVIHRYRPGGQS